MKNIYQIIGIFLFAIFSPHLQAQDGIIGSGWAGMNFSTIVGLSASAGSSQAITRTPAGTGNQFFRMALGANQQSPSGTCTPGQDTQITDVTGATEYTASNNNCTNGAWFINMPNNTDSYVIKTPSTVAGSNRFRVFRVQGSVQAINSVSQSPTAGTVQAGNTVTVTASLFGAFSTGQACWLRYTTDGFTTSTIVKMTMSSATIYTADIPASANVAGASVTYYAFTSGDLASITPANADYFTFNLNNNGGSNYSYNVQCATIADGNWSSTSTWANGAIPTSTQIANINHNVSVDVNVTRTALTTVATTKTLTINNGFTLGIGASLNGTAAMAMLQVNGVFQINNAGTTTFPPARINYANTSTLRYNTGASRNTLNEWGTGTSGAGVPYNVEIATTGTTLNLDNAGNRYVTNNFTLQDGTNLNLSTTNGIDLYIGGNWTNNTTNAGSVNVNNGRAIWLNGTGLQTIQRNAGAERFPYLINFNTGTGIKLLSDVNVTSNAGDVFQLLANSDFDLNDRTLNIGTSNGGNILIGGTATGNRNLVNTGAGTANINVVGSAGLTSKTFTNNNSKTLTIGNKINLNINTGGVDFGATLVTFGTGATMDIQANGYVATNVPTLATGSTLKYSTGGTFGRTIEWNTPHNVWVANNTNVTLGNQIAGADLTVNGNLQIDAGSTANLSGTANIIFKGNITNNGTFTPNAKKVTFDGTTQSISGTGVTNFYDLDINSSANITSSKNLSLVDFGGGNGTVNINGTLDMTTQQILSNSVGTKNINILGTFKTANTNGFSGGTNTAIENDNVTVNIGLGSTVEYNGAAQNVSERVDYQNIIFSGTGIKTCIGANPVVQKNLTIQSPVILNANTVNITLRGDWTNNGTFNPNGRKVSMDGNGVNQAIGGTSVTTFYQLTINKNNTVANKFVTLNRNINITGISLLLGANSAILSVAGSATGLGGKLNLNGFDVNFGNFGFLEEDYLTNPQEDDVVTDLTATTEANKGGKLIFNNRLVQTNTTLAATIYNAGYMSIYRTTGTDYSVNVIRRHYSAGFGQAIKRIYDVVVASGSAAGSNSVLAFGYKRSELNGLADNANGNLLMSKWEAGTGWTTTPALVHQTSNNAQFFGQINIGGVNSFSAWTASSTANALPITLAYFKASYLKERTTEISWKTISQVDNARFEVEKSIDGVNFNTIKTLDGAGTTNQAKDYSILDEDFTQSAYYRLRQVDNNGKFAFSQVEFVKYEGNLKIEIYPNPTTDRINIRLYENSEQNEVQITDAQGKTLINTQGNIKQIEENINAQLANWAKGIYFIKIRTQNKTYLQKLRKD